MLQELRTVGMMALQLRSLVPELIHTETFAGLTASADSGREPAAA